MSRTFEVWKTNKHLDLRVHLCVTLVIWVVALEKTSAAGPAVSVLIQSGTPQTVISGLFAGDRVELTVQLTTSDPNENGEGEPLVITSSGGFQASVPTYSIPQRLTFDVTKIGEKIEAYIAGYDGDESALVTVAVNSGEKQRFTAFQKDALKELNKQWFVIALFHGLMSRKFCEEFDPIGIFLCPRVEAATDAEALLSTRLTKLALDPSDPNFTTVPTPAFPSLPSVNAPTPALQPVADTINRLITKLEEGIGYAAAMQVCVDRAQGAADAGNVFWEDQQVAALRHYQVGLARSLGALPALYTNLRSQMLAAGASPFSITPQEVFNVETEIAQTGLATTDLKTLTQLGATMNEIDEIRNIFFVQDINAVAGAFPDRVVDPQFLTALRNVASILNPDTMPPQIVVAAKPALLWPPNGRSVSVTLSGNISDDMSGVDASSAKFSVLDEYGIIHPSGSITIGRDGVFSFPINLQASRSGNDSDGRHYTIALSATDSAGNKSTKNVVVTVPHDVGK